MAPPKKQHKSRASAVAAKVEMHHVVVGFEGFNKPILEDGGEEIPAAEDVVVNRILKAIKPGIDGVDNVHVHTIGISSDIDEDARDLAVEFIRKHMRVSGGRQRGKLIIYGYSFGGDTAMELADVIQGTFDVDLLVTVDIATGRNIGVDRIVPINVRSNTNFFTDAPPGRFGQQGAPNTAVDKKKTTVVNLLRSDDIHENIDERTEPLAIDLIRKELVSRRTDPLVEPVELFFDGKKLTVKGYVSEQVIAEFDARSGLPARGPKLKALIDKGRTDLDINTDYQDPVHQDKKDAGPIPEDLYSVKLNPGMKFDKKGGGFGIGGWRLETNFMNILAAKFFDGRNGFFLHHDGAPPGTAGCIGVQGKEPFKALRAILVEAEKHGQKEATIHVTYGPISEVILPPIGT